MIFEAADNRSQTELLNTLIQVSKGYCLLRAMGHMLVMAAIRFIVLFLMRQFSARCQQYVEVRRNPRQAGSVNTEGSRKSRNKGRKPVGSSAL